jgi:protoporphyrinogen oxidase
VTGLQVAGDPEVIPCSHVISTIALAALPRLAPDLDHGFRERLQRIDYLGVVCGLFKLKRPLTDSFWININDRRIPFNGIIEYSNLNRHLGLGSRAIAYVPYYLRSSHPRFGYDDAQLRREFLDGFRLVNVAFDDSWIEEMRISRDAYAQAVCGVGFAAEVPPHQTPLKGLYITDSTQFYPEDRTISAAIRLGRRVAAMIRDESPDLQAKG